jgi:hypothetical protein
VKVKQEVWRKVRGWAEKIAGQHEDIYGESVKASLNDKGEGGMILLNGADLGTAQWRWWKQVRVSS